ncbi:MAG TPA: type II toxin-antitoxin system VapC family toxin [Thermoanaerobaculia bacterium]|nr:type II toxin-antitoxin system VapC family toxin [Thermoanaerobaculia bacterium]
MILLDTHIWVWWVHGDRRLSSAAMARLKAREETGLGVSVISCWEVAKLVECRRLSLPQPIDLWMEQALAYPGIHLIGLTPPIVLESTRLPGEFHRDPADQLLVATARIHGVPMVTVDRKILDYSGVETLRLAS